MCLVEWSESAVSEYDRFGCSDLVYEETFGGSVSGRGTDRDHSFSQVCERAQKLPGDHQSREFDG